MSNAVLARTALRARYRRLTVKSGVSASLSLCRKKRCLRRFSMRFWTYSYKMRGKGAKAPPVPFAEICWSFGGVFLGMASLVLINTELWGRHEQGLLLGSFGASAILIFGAPHTSFAQPRNVVGGQMLSALVGVLVQNYVGTDPWLAASLAAALAGASMHLTATVHPPGGATALLAVIGSPELKSLGLAFVLYPVGISVVVLVAVGVLYNNLRGHRHYPVRWC